jgi:hypothetical protein
MLTNYTKRSKEHIIPCEVEAKHDLSLYKPLRNMTGELFKKNKNKSSYIDLTIFENRFSKRSDSAIS